MSSTYQPTIPSDWNAGLETLRSSIFRLQVSYCLETGEDVAASATGFVLGVCEKSRRLILATAGHVVNDLPKDRDVTWIVVQADERGDERRKWVFRTNAQTLGTVPYDHHKSLDVGLVFLPAADMHGSIYAKPDERPVPVIPREFGVTPGTPVAWAGFAGEIEHLFRFPCLCFFRGSVSMTVDRDTCRYYIIDGHNAVGVSGGPVWYWSDDRRRWEVFAIISGFQPGAQGLPGFVIAEPINTLMARFEHEIWQPDLLNDRLITDYSCGTG